MAPDPALAELYERKATAYRLFGNGVVADVASRLLPDGGRVLDVGCASGGLLAVLAERAGFLAGIELSRAAAQEAALVADQVVCAGVEDPTIPFESGSFDLVVLADVIEHLVDPAAALRRAFDWARTGGWVVVSVPNIAYWRARLTIAAGRFPQEESGTFDEGHLSFFTYERVSRMLAETGLEETAVRPVVPRLRHHLRLVDRLPGAAAEKIEAAWQAAGHRRPNLMGYQLVGNGRRPA